MLIALDELFETLSAIDCFMTSSAAGMSFSLFPLFYFGSCDHYGDF